MNPHGPIGIHSDHPVAAFMDGHDRIITDTIRPIRQEAFRPTGVLGGWGRVGA